jgi:hypothetical protein
MPVSSVDIAGSNARDAQDKVTVLAETLIWVLDNLPNHVPDALIHKRRLLDTFYQLKWKKAE